VTTHKAASTSQQIISDSQ